MFREILNYILEGLAILFMYGSLNSTADEGFLIEYEGYTVSYNPKTKIPVWVKYDLSAEETDGPYTRKGMNFKQDAYVPLPQAHSDDYRNSGWSKGHMAPAADFKWSENAMKESFYYTNCCPQDESLNSGQWSTLENKVRNWAEQFGNVTVVTGPIIGKNINGTIGENQVVIPDALFKAILADNQAIAFVMYNRSSNANMQKCAMSVNQLEKISGLDLFQELNDNIEEGIESTYSLKYWGL